MLFRKRNDALIKGQIGNLGGRVAWVTHHQHARPRHGEPHRPLQRLEIFLIRRCRHAADGRAGNDEAERVDRIRRVGRQHHVTGRGDRLRQIGQALLGTQRDNHLGFGINIHAEPPLIIGALRAAQPGDALGCAISMRIGLGGHFGQLGDHVRRRRQIGIAHAQIDDVVTPGPRCGPHGVHFRDHIGRQTFDAVEIVLHGCVLRQQVDKRKAAEEPFCSAAAG